MLAKPAPTNAIQLSGENISFIPPKVNKALTRKFTQKNTGRSLCFPLEVFLKARKSNRYSCLDAFVAAFEGQNRHQIAGQIPDASQDALLAA